MTETTKEPTFEFNTKQERDLAKADLATLLTNPGWVRIVDFWKRKLAYYEKQLREGKIENMDALYRLRDKMNMIEQSMNLPEIIRFQLDQLEGDNIQFDPYSAPEDEVIEKRK